MTIQENLTCKSIKQLAQSNGNKGICFHIPTYQRGYRWEKKEVTKLLEDLNSFFKSKKCSMGQGNTRYMGDFYCLQPITVMRRQCKNDDFLHYEVIDGQQRLITIFILLKTLGYRGKCFRIAFDRDDNNKEREQFLSDIVNASGPSNKADYSYMFQAREAIASWKFEYENDICFICYFTNYVKVIWYELPADNKSKPREVFRHINDGKLPLTDAELVKAMLLSSNRFAKDFGITADREKFIRIEQTQIARLWDEMERVLQNQEFWTFIYKDSKTMNTRLDFIFELVRHILNEDKITGESLIDYFEKKLSVTQDFDAVWDEARKVFRTFQDWYGDLTYYHLIGYLINCTDKKIVDILNLYLKKTKEEFVSEIRKLISENLKLKKDEIETLSYEGASQGKTDKAKIQEVLTLFNALESNAIGKRFVFQPKDDVWSIEHIFAQFSQLLGEAEKKTWLEKYKGHIERTRNVLSATEQTLSSLLSKISCYLSDPSPDSSCPSPDFGDLFRDILDVLESPGSTIDSIGNFALLSKKDNTALSNAPFYEKREKILEMNRSGSCIPIGTVNVFTKAYTKAGAATNLDYWSADDGERYKERIIEVVKNYLLDGGRNTDD